MNEKILEVMLRTIVAIKIAAQIHHEAGVELDNAANELQKLFLEIIKEDSINGKKA